MPNSEPRRGLCGRRSECDTLDRLVTGVRAGQSQVLVLRGEAGVGKTALLDHLVENAPACRLARATGVQSEMELAFAGMHQLCAPMLDRLERLPGPQRDALGTVFGLSAGQVPDPFFIGLALLGLLSEVAGREPLVCVIDDAQWLDRASARALGFVARRLTSESVALVLAVRDSAEETEFAGLPDLAIQGLDDADARALLGSVIRGPLDERVRDRIVAETRGNPLALLEMPRGLDAAQLAGGFGLPDAFALSGQIEESFLRRLALLPEATRRLLLVAAVEPVGESALVWRAAEQLAIGPDASAAAVDAGLIRFGDQVRFRHPLVRSAVYRAASLDARRSAHRALAYATDPDVDPDRRAWHLAEAAAGPDDYVADELERSAGRAQSRGGLAAAAAFLQRSAALTLNPTRRAQRLLAAAQAAHQAGASDSARGLLASAEADRLDELGRAHVDLLHARIVADSGQRTDAPSLLLNAARKLVPLDPGLARETYRDAFYASLVAGRLATPGAMRDVAEAVQSAGLAPEPSRPSDLLVDGLAVLLTDGHLAGVPMLQLGLSALRDQATSMEDGFRWLPLACRMSHDVWDDESWYVLSMRLVELARGGGALTILPIALMLGLAMQLFAGEFDVAASMAEEAEAVSEATGNAVGPYGTSVLAAWRGQEAVMSALYAAATADMVAHGQGQWLTHVAWTKAVLYNGLGRYREALAAAEQGSQYPDELGLATWSMVELIEAAARCGERDRAAAAFRRLSETTSASGTDWALGVQARARALLADGDAADSFYREAIERLGRTRMRVELARAQLVFGEWLRRQNRRVDAREQLRNAYDSFAGMGAAGFAERTRRELLATGETVRKRNVETRDELTAQEAQIARLARDGLTNPQIAAQLFISPRTVEWHLRKVFTKLGIGSRREIRSALPDSR